MQLFRKNILKAMAVSSLIIFSLKVEAIEDVLDFEENTEKYLQLCEYNYSDNEDMCQQFQEFLEKNREDAEAFLSELKESQNDIQTDITKYTQKLSDYNSSIKVLQEEVKFYNEKIDEAESKLSLSHGDVIDYENETVNTVNTIHGKFLEELIKAKTPIIKTQRPSGKLYYNILSVMESDMLVLNEIERNLGVLTGEQQAGLSLLEELEDEKNKVQDSLSVASELELEVRKMLVEYRRQEAEIIKNTNSTIKELNETKEKISMITGSIENISSSNGWIKPVQNGYVSAGTWHYPASFGGGSHTGIDYAATIGTTIYAPANGVILYSTYGCANNGYLGNRCGADGISGAGNQTYMIASVNGNIYGISFYHMNDNSALASGTVVSAGEKIGEVGSSGNSTGPHAHIETTYLGNMSIEEYIENWDGDLTFGAGIGQYSLVNTCTNKNGEAPCKLQPESLFGEEINDDQ